MDAVTAFLQGDLTKEINMLQSELYEKSNEVCKLRKSIYGLKQASRVWNIEFDTCLENCKLRESKFDFQQYNFDSGRVCRRSFVIFECQIDEDDLEELLMNSFEMVDMGKAKSVLWF
ncbi:hypothetical protein JTB14_038183 [Gonioctena quinquepunctata]|nr:hypothetical protein JTB14_038183 [Gonioctena quinquepunctata]